jgi:hypothetical protein
MALNKQSIVEETKLKFAVLTPGALLPGLAVSNNRQVGH